jgi:hypothetical protein
MRLSSWCMVPGTTGQPGNRPSSISKAKDTRHLLPPSQGVNKNVNHAQCTKSVADYIVDNCLSDIVLPTRSPAKLRSSSLPRLGRRLQIAARLLWRSAAATPPGSCFAISRRWRCTEIPAPVSRRRGTPVCRFRPQHLGSPDAPRDSRPWQRSNRRTWPEAWTD